MGILNEALARRSGTIRRAFILLSVIVLNFPIPILPMELGLDSSWMAGINFAMYSGLVFGRDIMFTYGPLGFVLVPVDIGSNAWLWTAVTAHMVPYGLWWLSIGLVLSHLDDVTDELLFAIGSFVATYSGSSENVVLFSVVGFLAVAQRRGSLTWGLLAAAIAGAALLSKFNVGVGCVGAVFAWLMLVALREPVKTSARKVAATLATLAVTVTVGYAAAEGNFQNLLAFFRYSFVIAGDYSAQMSNKGPMWQVALMAGLVTAVVGYVFAGARLDWKSWDIAAIILLPVFMSYKSAITRHDSHHFAPGVLGASALPIFLLVADSCRVGRAETGVRCFVAVMLFSGISGFVASGGPTPAMIVALGTVGLLAFGDFSDVRNPSREGWFGPRVRRAGVLACLFVAFAGSAFFAGAAALPKYPASVKLPRGPENLLALLHLKSWLAMTRAELADSRDGLTPQLIATVGKETIDVYPWEISLLLLNGLNWSPRFMMQSYPAYSPPLDERGAEHFRGEGAPKFVLYEHTQIDSDHPFIVDPATLCEIYRWYDFNDQAGRWLLLSRRREPRWRESSPTVGSATVAFGERWEVPAGLTPPVFLKARLRLNTLGRLTRTFYRIMPPWIRVEYEDGTVNYHRLVWRNTEEGFLISDLPRDLRAVRSLFEGGQGDRVKGVSFLGNPRFFDRQIGLEWSEGAGKPGS
jgi:hypothetical protein